MCNPSRQTTRRAGSMCLTELLDSNEFTMKLEKPGGRAEDFSPIERELIALKALTDSLDSMLNHSVLTLRGTDPKTEIVFESSIHQRLFNILLVDFLAKPDKAIVGLEGSYLEVLSGIC